MGNITLIEFNEWLNSSDFVWEDMESCKTYKDTDKLGICIFFPNEWENPKEKVLTEKRFKDFIKTSPVGYEINDTEDFQPSKDFTCDVFCTEVIFEDLMSELCNCDVAEDTHEHCIECENVLKCNESENLCRWCEERIADEANNKEFA